MAGAVATWAGTAALIGRPRPPAALRASGVSAHGTGYPSLSATVAAAGLGVIVALVCTQPRRLGGRAAIGSGAVVAAFGVGMSQIYLGIQWMSDVAVGWLLGAGWLAVIFALPRPTRSAAVANRSQQLRSGPTGDDEHRETRDQRQLRSLAR
jgi:membrane-associated phospholipid phosphatase